jgi:predicted ATP-grasp superfamily ATP-dependent carboligase
LLSLGAESFVFHYDIQKYEDSYTQNYNFTFSFYGCETWSLILKEQRKLRVLENRVLGRIFGPKKYGKQGSRAVEKTT